MLTNLKAIRQSWGVTQTELASRVGVSQVAICRLESGQRQPRLATALKIAAALGTTVDELTTTDERNDFERAA